MQTVLPYWQKANQFRLDKEYDSAISLLDSAFLLPVKSDQHPNGLSPDDARRLMSYAIKHLMFAYNHSRRIAEGHEHFLRLKEMNHPILSNHCQREILVCDAQMLQTLGRRAEACQLLDQAMSINENDDPSSELFCTIAAGITYMAVDSTETRAEPTLLRAAEAMRNGAYDDTGLYPQAMPIWQTSTFGRMSSRKASASVRKSWNKAINRRIHVAQCSPQSICAAITPN